MLNDNIRTIRKNKGFTQEDVETERQAGLSGAKAGDFAETSRELVERRLPRPERAEFHVGYFPDSFRVIPTVAADIEGFKAVSAHASQPG